MKSVKTLGIWMDHASAHLLDLSDEIISPTIIESTFTHQEKQEILNKGESHMHNKEQGEQSGYYKELGEVIKKYDEVLLFGPTDAKTELFNVLKKDHHFDQIKIEVKSADKMSENQEHAFVKEHFAKS